MPTFTHYPVPAAELYYPYGEPLGGVCEGPDGNLWCSSQSTENLYIMSPGGTLLDTGAGMVGGKVVLGSDGRVWGQAASAGLGAIGLSAGGPFLGLTIAQGGLVETVYGSNSYHDLCLGPDGNIWLTDAYSDLVWSCTPAGVLTSYSLTFRPYYICALGSYLYVTKQYATEIAQVSTGGSVIATILVSVSSMFDIGAGPDGNLWVGTSAFGQYARVAPDLSGQTTFSLSSGVAAWQPKYPIAGPDGNLWIAGQGPGSSNGYVWVLTDLGGVPIPYGYSTTTDVPGQLCVGPSDTMWAPDQAEGVLKVQLP